MNNENFELEDMREQMSTLKKKLNPLYHRYDP